MLKRKLKYKTKISKIANLKSNICRKLTPKNLGKEAKIRYHKKKVKIIRMLELKTKTKIQQYCAMS